MGFANSKKNKQYVVHFNSEEALSLKTNGINL